MTAFLEIRDLVVKRGERTALHIAALDLRQGEVLALVGPNGAGKSTLLLTLARLIPMEGGRVVFNNRCFEEWDALEYRRKLSFVFQDPLLMDMSVGHNVGLGLRFRGNHNGHATERTDYWLRQLGIEGLAKRRAVELSGGEAQRVSLARALVLEPELLLLDEPFSALDPLARARLMDDLSGLLERDHRTTIFVTHDLKEAARLGHRIGVMIGGTLRQVGTAQEIKDGPADEEVEAFVRSM